MVTSLMVRSPVTSKVFSPVFFHDLLLKVAVGNLAASKKSGLLMWLSRFSLDVATESIAIVASTLLASGAAGS